MLCEPQVCELITKSETRNWKTLKTRCLVKTQRVLSVKVTLADSTPQNAINNDGQGGEIKFHTAGRSDLTESIAFHEEDDDAGVR